MTRLRRHGKIGAKKRGGEKVKKFKVICEAAWFDSKGTLTVKWLPLTKEETLELIEFVDKIKEITVR